MNVRLSRLKTLAVALPLAIAPVAALPGNPITRNTPTLLEQKGLTFEQRPAAAYDRPVEVFVRLSGPSVAEYVNAYLEKALPEPDKDEQKAHAKKVDKQQAAIRRLLASLGAQELSSLRVGANGLRIRIDVRRLSEIRGLPGVVSVAPVTRHKPSLARSVPWVGAPAVWGGTDGAGVTVAVIDTGIDYTHANFGGPGTVSDYTGNDKTIIEPGSFPTAKVIGGFDFAGASYDAGGGVGSTTPSPDPDPLDGDGHGSHVAGIAAGLGVPGKIGPGVAKGASLYALKVFGDVAGSTSLTSDAIEFALDPNGDGSTDDHVDVINMSLGSGFGSPDDPSAIAAQNAAKLGIIVVASAGNSGDVNYITGSPAVAEDAISVASSLSGGAVLAIEVTAPAGLAGKYEAVEGAISVPLSTAGFTSGPLVAPTDVLNTEGCAAIADDLTGAIALISRGSCTFSAKHLNAQGAGAIGIVVYNNVPGVSPIVMGGSSAGIAIPGVMITNADGVLLSGGAGVAADMDTGILTATAFGDVISGFSSRGPGHGGSRFKPDVTAPGSGIVSTGVGSGDGPATISGTSMAAPHVAGLAALMRATFPSAKVKQIKAMIQNATVDGSDGGVSADLARQGTGVIRADRAAALTSVARPGGVSFGRVNPEKPVTLKEEVELENLVAGPRSFTVTHVPNQTLPGVTVACPDQVNVGSFDEEEFKIELTMNPALSPFDDAFHSQTEVDGWCVLDDGVDVLRVGYLAVVDPASKMRAKGGDQDKDKDKDQDTTGLTIDNRGQAVGFAEGFTLIGENGANLNKQPNAIKAFGVRTSNFGFDVVEFGIATERPWETLAAYEIDIYIDADQDGFDDFILVAADFFGDGVPITAIFPQGAALFFTGADLNDESAVLSFVRSDFGLGFLAAGDTTFDYRVEFFDLRDGSVDVQSGSVDLAAEIVPDLNSFGLAPGGSATINTTGPAGEMMWLFQNNRAKKQLETVNN